jgi:hypothetical protein
MNRLYYRLIIKKCINGRLKINFSLVKFPAIREILKKRSLLINVRTVNTMAIQSLFIINKRDMIFVQKIIQLYNITVKFIKLVTVANTLHVLIILEVILRTTKNVTNGKSYYKNNIEIVRGPTSKTH